MHPPLFCNPQVIAFSLVFFSMQFKPLRDKLNETIRTLRVRCRPRRSAFACILARASSPARANKNVAKLVSSGAVTPAGHKHVQGGRDRPPAFVNPTICAPMKARTRLKRAAIFAATAVSMSMLLSACATSGPNTPDGCVGPMDYCMPFFGG
jgi:hypothetical protein